MSHSPARAGTEVEDIAARRLAGGAAGIWIDNAGECGLGVADGGQAAEAAALVEEVASQLGGVRGAACSKGRRGAGSQPALSCRCAWGGALAKARL